jgi:diadenosine tetraphosphate (Ap4A) HIT family hydrolase
MDDFSLDPHLDRDTLFIGDLDLCRVQLMDDSRWPWLVLVPRRADKREIYDLDHSDQVLLMREVAQVGAVFMKLTGGEKLNVAALGNVVPQLHIHLVARKSTDFAWPKPVWGLFPRQQYEPAAIRDLVPRIASSLGLPEPE